MMIFTRCPKCGDPLVNDFLPSFPGTDDLLRKSCKKRLNHQFQCLIDQKDNSLHSVTVAISLNPLIRVAWYFKTREFLLATGTIEQVVANHSEVELPFFEPDFSDYDRLVAKVKTYVMFS